MGIAIRGHQGSSVPAFLAVSCVGFIASAPALAADGVPAPAAEPQDTRGDVIVNGERRDELDGPKAVAKVVNTPRSVVVLPREVIEQSGSTTLQDALRTVPGITFGAAEGGNPIGDRPFIRGYDSQGSVYLDGVRDIGSQSREVFAVEQVQVVRGSDSTLGGRGNAGGSINIISKAPQATSFASAAVSYGTDDYKRVSADVNARISGNVAARLNAVWHDQDVAGRDALFQKRWGVAPSITVGIDSPTSLTLSYYHLSTDELPDSGIPYLYTINNAPAGADITFPAESFTTADGRSGTVDRDTFYGLVNRDFRKTDIDQASFRVEHDFGGITLRNTARYARSDQRYIFSQPDDSQGNVYNTGQVFRRVLTRFGATESLIDQIDLYGKVDTGGIEHSFAAGAEFAWEDAERGAYNTVQDPRCTPLGIARYNCTDAFDPDPYAPYVNYASDTSNTVLPIARNGSDTTTLTDIDSQSVYAFDSITLIPQLLLNLGARYDWYSTRVRAPVVDGVRAEASLNDQFFNWQAGLVFKPTSATSLYASYATSSTPPGSSLGEGREGNALGGSRGQTLVSLDDLRAEESKNYEVGAKADLFDSRLGVSLAAFRTETDNARTTGPDGFVEFLGKQRVQGIEFGLNGTPAARMERVRWLYLSRRGDHRWRVYPNDGGRRDPVRAVGQHWQARAERARA